MTDAFGSITWWGFSPSLDLQQKDINIAFKDISFTDIEEDALNVLLVGAGDCRHILKTFASAYRHQPRQINFYVIENNLELYARTMLLMTIVLEPASRMGLQDKTELFLELFGNSLVRQQCMEYVKRFSTEFIKMVTDFDYLKQRMPIIDLSMLKYKERDFLEGIFKCWRNKNGMAVLDISHAWDLRVRKHLGTRYDAIPNIFDWDCSIKLSDRGASIIHSKQYAQWRKEGVAFEIREASYETPNLTLASGMVLKHDGERYPRRGYWGDIVVSPYISFGVESEERSFFKKSNNMYTKSAVDVSEYNILSMLYEIANKEKYVPPKTENTAETPEPGKLTELTEEEAEVEPEATPVADSVTDPPSDQDYESLPAENIRIFFLPVGSLSDLHKKSRFAKLFNMVYISNSMVHLLTSDVLQTVADKASLILESAKFMIELENSQYLEFYKKITAIAQGLDFKPASDNVDKNAFARFTFTREAVPAS